MGNNRLLSSSLGSLKFNAIRLYHQSPIGVHNIPIEITYIINVIPIAHAESSITKLERI